jgi:hypothetical protein
MEIIYRKLINGLDLEKYHMVGIIGGTNDVLKLCHHMSSYLYTPNNNDAIMSILEWSPGLTYEYVGLNDEWMEHFGMVDGDIHLILYTRHKNFIDGFSDQIHNKCGVEQLLQIGENLKKERHSYKLY